MIEGVRGSSYTGDISIDDVSLTPGCLVCPKCTPIDGELKLLYCKNLVNTTNIVIITNFYHDYYCIHLWSDV